MSKSLSSNISFYRNFLQLPRIHDQDELLDTGAGTPHDVQQSLDDLWRINRFLGGISAVTRHLYPRLCREKVPVTLVDLGTGSGQLARHIAQWAQQNHCTLRVYGLDIAARHLNIAAVLCKDADNLCLAQGNALQLPFAEASVDYLISSLFVHHLEPPQVIDLLRQSFRCVRKALIISDLQRGWLPLVAFKLGQPIFARSYLTRHDGAVSIRRGYTPAEFFAMAQAAGLTHCRVIQHFPWRMTLVAEKS
ncbi:MAG: class I SAM-dependent methyltransferase [Anaerolineae bacterium]